MKSRRPRVAPFRRTGCAARRNSTMMAPCVADSASEANSQRIRRIVMPEIAPCGFKHGDLMSRSRDRSTKKNITPSDMAGETPQNIPADYVVKPKWHWSNSTATRPIQTAAGQTDHWPGLTRSAGRRICWHCPGTLNSRVPAEEFPLGGHWGRRQGR